MSSVKKAVTAVGGVTAAARLCGVSPRAINKWVAAGKLPRTEFTGETRYAEMLQAGANAKGDYTTFSAETLKADSVAAYQQAVSGAHVTESRPLRSAPNVPVQASSTGRC